MRYIEITSGIRVSLSKEEKAILDREEIILSGLSEREAEVARVMVRKGVLNRYEEDDEVIFTPNQWMD